MCKRLQAWVVDVMCRLLNLASSTVSLKRSTEQIVSRLLNVLKCALN